MHLRERLGARHWVLSVMDAETAEPIPCATEPFTRLGRSILEAKATWLTRYEIPWRIDAVRQK